MYVCVFDIDFDCDALDKRDKHCFCNKHFMNLKRLIHFKVICLLFRSNDTAKPIAIENSIDNKTKIFTKQSTLLFSVYHMTANEREGEGDGEKVPNSTQVL